MWFDSANVGRHFFKSNNVGRHFCPYFQGVCPDFQGCCEDFHRFCPDFRQIEIFWGALSLPPPTPLCGRRVASVNAYMLSKNVPHCTRFRSISNVKASLTTSAFLFLCEYGALWPRLWSRTRKEWEVFGWSRIPKISRSRIWCPTPSQEVQLNHFCITLLSWAFLFKWYNFKLLLKQIVFAMYHDFHWLLVGTKLLTAKLHSHYVNESRVGNFGKVGVGHFTSPLRNPVSDNSGFVASSSTSAHRAPGKKATVPIYKVLVPDLPAPKRSHLPPGRGCVRLEIALLSWTVRGSWFAVSNQFPVESSPRSTLYALCRGGLRLYEASGWNLERGIF